MLDLVVIVLGCDIKKRYYDELLKIEDTYSKLFNKNNLLLYILGEEKVLVGEKYIHLNKVANDYSSCFTKQFKGLKYVKDNYKFKFVMCITSDTYLNVKKLTKLINNYNPDEKLYIGGSGDLRNVMGENIYYHGGGPGFILSYSCLDDIYKKISEPSLKKWWNSICKISKNKLSNACDVCIAYIINLYSKETKVIKLNNMFFHCNYLSKTIIKQSDIVSCHNMRLIDFDNFTKILEENYYFI